MDIEQAKVKAMSCHMTSISLDEQPFVPLIKIKRSDVKTANSIRVVLSKRRSSRIHYFLQRYESKIVLVHSE
jgi:hypothetical protein